MLSEAVGSVLSQTWRDFTLLISDNASTDGTADFVASVKDRRIIYHRHPVNRGLGPNWRFGLTWPKSGIVAILEDDNLWLPHHLENAVQSLKEAPGAAFYGCATDSFGDSNAACFGPYWCTGSKEHWTPERAGYAGWLRGTPIAASSVVVRRGSLDGLMWGPARLYANDYLWWGQLALKGGFVYDPNVGARYHFHDSNISKQFRNPRGAAQYRYTIRILASAARDKGFLRDLVSEVCDWPVCPLATLVVALAALDSHRDLRKAANKLMHARPDLGVSPDSSGHCRIASKLGLWYLSYADILDRVRGRWWGR